MPNHDSCGTCGNKLDDILGAVTDVRTDVQGLRGDVTDHGKMLERLDERTELQGRRMDRMEQRAQRGGAATGAAAGGVMGPVVSFLLKLLGLGNGS